MSSCDDTDLHLDRIERQHQRAVEAKQRQANLTSLIQSKEQESHQASVLAQEEEQRRRGNLTSHIETLIAMKQPTQANPDEIEAAKQRWILTGQRLGTILAQDNITPSRLERINQAITTLNRTIAGMDFLIPSPLPQGWTMTDNNDGTITLWKDKVGGVVVYQDHHSIAGTLLHELLTDISKM